MKKALVIGGATLDTIIKYEQMETLIHQRAGFEQSYLLLEEGGKIEVREQHYFSGGGATNAAASLKKLDFDVDLFCKVGRDVTGELLVKELQEFGLDTSHVLYSSSSGTATSFVVPSLSGDRALFAYRGANATLLKDELPCELISDADFLYITSLSKASAERLPQIVEMAHQSGTKVAINPGSSQLSSGCQYLKASLKHIDMLIMNVEEAQLFYHSLKTADHDLLSEHEQLLTEGTGGEHVGLREFFQLMLSLGPKVVVATNGNSGVYVCTESELLFHPAAKTNVVNTLGAGDAFGSCFAGTYFASDDIQKAIRCGVVNSANVVSQMSAKGGLMSQGDIDKKIATLDESALTSLPWS